MAILCAFVTLCLSSFSLSTFAATNDLEFEATFDQASPAASAKVGTVDSTIPAGMDPEFTPGVRGLAFQTRGDKHEWNRLTYDASMFWPETRGTLAFWTKGDNLKVTWDDGFSFLQVSGANGWMWFYKPGRHPWFGNLSRYRLSGESHETDSYLFVPETTAYGADYNVWRLWAITWNGKRARLYLDGLFLAENPNFVWPESPSALCIHNGSGNMAIRFDDVRVYNRPLDADELRRIWHETMQPVNSARVSVPLAQKTVTLDGKLSPDEWSDATEIRTYARGGVFLSQGNGLLKSEPTAFYLKRDADNLYFAARSPWPEETLKSLAMTAGMTGLLKTSKLTRDGDFSNDDHFEMDLAPAFPNGKCFRLQVNADNVQADSIWSNGKEDRLWNPNWKAVTSKDDKGWYLEAVIPWKEMGGAPTNAVWGLNVQRIWRALKQEGESWAWGTRWARRPSPELIKEPGESKLLNATSQRDLFVPVGEMAFGEDKAIVVSDLAFGAPDQGKVNFRATIVNSGKSEVYWAAGLESGSGEVRKVFANTNDNFLKLGPGETIKLEHAQALRNPSTANLDFAVWGANPASGGISNVLYRSEVHFIREQRMEVITWHYPSTGLLRLRLIASRLVGRPLEKTSAVVELIAENGKSALDKTIKPLTGTEQEITLDTAKLPSGKYQIRTRLFDDDHPSQGDSAPNKELFRNETPFEKYPLPPWFNTNEGISDKVPPPFTPVRLEDGKGQDRRSAGLQSPSSVGVWGREYIFKDRMLPVQIKTQGMEVLRGPVRLVGSVATATQKTAFDTSVQPAKIEWRTQEPTRLEGGAEWRQGATKIVSHSWIEYDGFLWTKIAISASSPLFLERLAVEIPFARAFSDVINPCDYSLRTTGALKPEGYASGAHTVWLGNAYGGLQWTCDSRANWRTEKPADELRVEPGPEGATMRITMLDVSTKLDKPVVFSFGLQATPVKPRYPEYRRWLSGHPRVHWEYAWYPGEQVFRAGAEGWFDWKFIPPKPADHLQNTWWRDSSAKRLCEKIYTGPYVTTDIVDASTSDFAQFCDEWSTEADKKFVPDPNSKTQSSSACADVKSYRDYFTWRYARLMDKSPFAGLYYDVSGGTGGANEYNGTGVRARDGKLVPTNGMLGLRNIAKRLYTLVKLRYPDGIIKYHNSGVPVMAFMSFAEASVDGENTFSLLSSQKLDYYGTMRPDVWRAEYMGHNLGFVTDFLPQLTRSQKWNYEQLATKEGLAVSDHIIGQTLLHDANIWASYISSDAMNRLQQALRKHHWGNQYKMIPYWEQKVVTLQTNRFATFYVEQGKGAPAPQAIDLEGWYYRSVPGPARRVICVFHNDSEWSGEVRLKLDWAQIGVSSPKDYKIENAVHRFTFPIIEPGAAKTGKIEGAGEEQFLVKYTEDPKEFARVEGEELVFPMTPWNYRMIVLWRDDQ